MNHFELVIDYESCWGCKTCEVACKQEHHTPDGIKLISVSDNCHSLNGEKEDVVYEVKRCEHCDDPPCVIACLSGAMHLDEEAGIVMHDAEKCIGCWTCIMVCPYGAIRIDDSSRKVVAKCNLCLGLDIPTCVANCPNEALVFREVMP